MGMTYYQESSRINGVDLRLLSLPPKSFNISPQLLPFLIHPLLCFVYGLPRQTTDGMEEKKIEKPPSNHKRESQNILCGSTLRKSYKNHY